MLTAEDEELRRRKLEEALEVESLRRIISAYLNYPEAAEEDIRRYERCFRRLPPAHKALLPHIPFKFQKLRWCISQNSYFIFEMLKAFEPPIDLNQNIENSEGQNMDNTSDNCALSDETKLPSQSGLKSGNLHSWAELGSEKGDNGEYRSPNRGIVTEVSLVSFVFFFKKFMLLLFLFVYNYLINDFHYFVSSRLKFVRSSKKDHWKTICFNTSFYASVFLFFCRNTSINALDFLFQVSSSPPDWLDPSMQFHVPLVDVDKVRCIIRNVVRDWAAEGQKERDECYKPILKELQRLFPHRSKESPPTCLVPGAGLGRLALEISCLGFISQGNEFSYYMMICSSFILNQSQVADEWRIYPWIHSNCNSFSDDDQLRPVSIPDIHPASSGITEGFSMCGGDFVEVYNDPSQVGVWDAVVTCFFLDTAHNILEYIEIISRILKDGGVWINLGPLLYHFADTYNQEDEMSIELSLKDVKRVSCHYGFEIQKESMVETTYTTNPRSMMQNHYNAAFWTMHKKPAAATQAMK
ncbi:carnosine N-methyltransferase-like [Primulina huaijiensis]|uniref:carnosine N-methyltransferase-like n=1 Tax=Primulina huaijiensis TaxID=1492673 RepID=UPI003CC75350